MNRMALCLILFLGAPLLLLINGCVSTDVVPTDGPGLSGETHQGIGQAVPGFLQGQRGGLKPAPVRIGMDRAEENHPVSLQPVSFCVQRVGNGENPRIFGSPMPGAPPKN